ncbi:hypothetical protein LRAMOSA09030 [Lichtheimia ramosa]|uniref:Heterokaryon incompatibility domain-containing protein n=1 Tax=Lichtheimia ramosa TaxID=688394 RepID=A0A077WIU1_9FUNG|nr:hypothetical protein LRAMOSA09030 [Lichtheimia ramosa]
MSGVSSNNDPVQIHVNTHDWTEQRKELFEKRVNALLHDPDFLLLYVPKDEETKLQLVKPVDDSYHRNRIIHRINESKGDQLPTTWYAISHLWGSVPPDSHLWRDIGHYLNDEYGKPVELKDYPYSLRLQNEKRQPLFKLFRHYPDDYWWIDNLCVRNSSFSDHMSSIFTCCTQCIALVDCDPTVISQIHSMKSISISDNMPFSATFLDQYEKLNNLLVTLTGCRWWKRVWSWQEMVLPQEILFMAETTTQVSSDTMIHVDDLYRLEATLGKMLFVFMKNGARPLHAPTTAFKELRYSRQFHKHHVYDMKDPRLLISLMDVFGRSSREALYETDYIYGVLGVLPLDMPRMNKYIMEPNEGWRCFLSKLDNFLLECMRAQLTTTNMNQDAVRLVTINDEARNIDLKAARNMADVYRNLLSVFECVV